MSAIAAGFGDKIHDSQTCFRQLLTTMSQPGTIAKLNLAEGFGSMMPATTQVLLALADNSTPTWLSNQFANEPGIIENLNFHLGCTLLNVTSNVSESKQAAESQKTNKSPKTNKVPQTSQPQQQATFAVIAEQDLASFNWQQAPFYMGCEEYPDRSTTVIIEVAGMNDTAIFSVEPLLSKVSLSLTGPGIKHSSLLVLESVSESTIKAILSIRSTYRFPLGLDFIFVSGEQVVSIPRSTKVELLSCM